MLRLRGGPSPRKKERAAKKKKKQKKIEQKAAAVEEEFEQLDSSKFSGAEQKVSYSIQERVSLKQHESCVVPMKEYALPCAKVLVYDSGENEIAA